MNRFNTYTVQRNDIRYEAMFRGTNIPSSKNRKRSGKSGRMGLFFPLKGKNSPTQGMLFLVEQHFADVLYGRPIAVLINRKSVNDYNVSISFTFEVSFIESRRR